MRAADLFGQTLREAPADAQIASHRLLVRGAFIRPVAAGVYAWLALGRRVLRRVEQIVREEMDAHGAVEVLMPALLPMDLLERTGRADPEQVWGGELYTLCDPGGRDLYLGPTHEEVVTFLASTELPSYKDLPSIPYQIQWKYRYAPRARGGLLRGREFLMKDAYSFDADEEGLRRSYERMASAYARIFRRCGLQTVTIDAESGAMSGGLNQEFTQPSEAGNNTFVRCGECGYAANTEVATSRASTYDFGEPAAAPRTVHTPGRVTVEEVSSFLGCEPRRLVKALLYRFGDEVVCALVPGDRELNEHKFARAIGGTAAMLTDEDFARTGFAKGFAGPVGLRGARLLADETLRGARNLVCGANKPDHHLTDVVPGRDFVPNVWLDLGSAQHGDMCPRCAEALSLVRGIEVGHIFQLGTRYSAPMGAEYSDQEGRRRPFVMGCYGLGISRVVAAIVETHHDDRGIAWPRAVGPFDVAILLLSSEHAAVAAAEQIHDELPSLGIDVLLDDRTVSPGIKFADADLIGYPLQVVVGKTFASNAKLEAKVRATGERREVDVSAAAIAAALAACP